jgi:hypothetical protein
VKIIVCVAEWSRACRSLKEQIIKLEGKFISVKFALVDVEKCLDVKKLFSIASVPTWLIMKKETILQGSRINIWVSGLSSWIFFVFCQKVVKWLNRPKI